MTTESKCDQPGSQKAQEASQAPLSGNTGAAAKRVPDATEVAAQAAAIAAKIGAPNVGAIFGEHPEHQFVRDIDINEVRNRYILTKASTQQQIQEESGGAVVRTKGVWYPDRSLATELDPPLYLHVTAATAEVLQRAVDRINELMNVQVF